MTRYEKLYSMRLVDLAPVAESLGIKINIKGKKDVAVVKILEAEAKKAEQAQAAAEAAEAEVAEEQIANETTCGDGTPFVEVMEEITAGAEKRAKEARKPRKKKEQSADVSALLAFILDTWQSVGGIVKMPAKENALFRPLCADNGRQVIKLMWTKKKVSFFVRVEAATVHAEKWQKINYSLPFQCMFFHDTEEVRQDITKIFQTVLASDSIRQKKTKKQSKKEVKKEVE